MGRMYKLVCREPCRRIAGAGALLLAVTFTVTAPLANAGGREAGLARLVGVWQLDQRVSDDPGRLLRPRGGGPPPADRGEDRPRPDYRQRAAMVIEGANVLTFAYNEGELTITNWDDEVQVLVVNGKKRQAQRKGIDVQVEAGWKSSDRLVVKTTGAPGGWIRETYELGGRGEKLFVTVELQRQGSRWPLSFQRLYNRAGD